MKEDKEILDLFDRNLAHLVVIKLNLFYTIKSLMLECWSQDGDAEEYETMKRRSLTGVA